MLVFRVISLSELKGAQDLLEQAFRETSSSAQSCTLSVNWGLCQRLRDAGLLFFLGCFATTTLVGFAALTKTEDFWREGMVVAVVNTLYLHPEHRRGYNGVRLIKHTEKLAMAIDCNELSLAPSIRSRTRGGHLTDLLVNLGYSVKEIVTTVRL